MTAHRNFKAVANTSKVTASKSKGLLDKSIKPPRTSGNGLIPGIYYFYNDSIEVKFDGNYLTQGKVKFAHKKQWTFL